MDFLPSGKHNLGKGILYIGDSLSELRDLGEVDDFNFTIAVDKIELTSSRSGLNVIVDEAVTKQDANGSFQMIDQSIYNNQLFSMAATPTENNQAASTGLTTTIIAKTGLYVPINSTFSEVNFENVVVKDSTETTTYVENTDYTFDYDTGLLCALSSGSINNDEELHITYDVKQASTENLYGATQQIVEKFIYFKGNQAKGKLQDLWCYASLTPNGNKAMIGTDWEKLGINFKMLERGYFENGLYRFRNRGDVS